MKEKAKKKFDIFINEFENIDCAILYRDIGPVGQSWKVNMRLTGSLNSDGMLIDFSYAKKQLRKIFKRVLDHKLLVRKSAVKKINKRYIACERVEKNSSKGWFTINTYSENITLIPDAFFLKSKLTSYIEHIICQEIMHQKPSNIEAVSISLRDYAKKSNYLSYTHSLAGHSGVCQRYHGHSGILNIFLNGQYNKVLSAKAINEIQNVFFVNSSYKASIENDKYYQDIIENFPHLANDHSEENSVFIKYQGSMGTIAIFCPYNLPMWINAETTAENIAAYLKDKLDIPEEASIHVYEGIDKGAVA